MRSCPATPEMTHINFDGNCQVRMTMNRPIYSPVYERIIWSLLRVNASIVSDGPSGAIVAQISSGSVRFVPR